MTASTRILSAIAAALLIGGGVILFAITWRPAIGAVDPATASSFDPALVKRGRQLAAIGNCSDCHTARGGADFAGGVAVPTTFGTVFSINITPDRETGIGSWPEAAFRRAMKSGVSRTGQQLYPTFPYDHFINITDEDAGALYAYLMTRQPVHAPARPNQLSFPFNLRPLIAGWKLLYLRPAEIRPDPSKSEQWNRGVYLVEGLAHCGACHTPRNVLGAEQKSQAFAGGEADNWSAYAINAQSPSPVPWNEEALFAYLRHGWHADHGVARGPMAQVVNNLASVDRKDVEAIAVYAADLFGTPAAERVSRGEAVRAEAAKRKSSAASTSMSMPLTLPSHQAGADIYEATCAGCHESARALPYAGVDLHLSSGINASDPRNVANTILAGVPAAEGVPSPIMPGYAASMTDAQITALLNYLRARFSRSTAWSNVEDTIAEARQAQATGLPKSAEPSNIRDTSSQRGQP